jgi:hypothetical protein
MFWRLTFALLCLLPITIPVQETYTIRFKKSTKGTTTHKEKKDVNNESFKITDNAGNSLDDKAKKEQLTWVFDETILERPDVNKKATLIKRTYEKATVTAEGETKALAVQGKTVIIEKKDGNFTFRYENGGAVAGEDAEHLDKEFNKENDDIDAQAFLLPKKAVGINEEWKVAMPEFLKRFEKQTKMTVDIEKAKGTGKLLKAYKQDGRQFGDVVISMQFPVKTVKTEDGEIEWQPGTLMTIELKAAACIDGSVEDTTGQWSVVFNGVALVPSADNPMARIVFGLRGTSEVSVKELTGK